MQLLTTELIERFQQIGSQENIKDPIVVAKFFNPGGAGTWLATEYFPQTRTLFGFVSLFNNDEWGYFGLDELENTVLPPYGLSIERDLYFEEKPISQCVPKALL